MVKWLHTNGFKCTTEALQIAAGNGHLNILQWLNEISPELVGNTDIMDYATLKNHFDIVKWIHENRADGCSDMAVSVAARNGNLEMMQWLIANRPEYGVAKAAHQSCPFAEEEDSQVAKGVPIEALIVAAIAGHLEIIKFLLDHHQNDVRSTFTMDFAAANGHLEVVKWLHCNRPNDCTTFAMDLAASKGHLAVVQWLHEHRTEGCTIVAMDQAASDGHLNVVQWLLENRSEGCSVKGLSQAALNDHANILALLLSSRPDLTVTATEAKIAACRGHFQVIETLEKFDAKLVERTVAQMLHHHREFLVNAYLDVDDLLDGSSSLTYVDNDKYDYEYDDDDFN